MNATPPVSQAPRASDPAQLNSPESGASQTTPAANQDFAAALSDAGVKPARKHAANKRHDAPASGSALPAPGNQPPLPLTPAPPPKADVSPAPAKAPDVAGAVKGQPGEVVADPNAVAVGGAVRPMSADFNPAPVPASAPAATTAAAAAQASAPAPETAPAPQASGSATPDAAKSGVVPSSGLSMPQASIQSHVTAPALPATAPTSTAGNATMDDAALGNGPAADADAAAQAIMAAAVVQGTSAPSQAASADDLATPDTGVLQGVAGTSDAPASAAANSGVAHLSAAATSAAVTAATAAAIAQAVSSASDAGAADKRSHGSNPNSSLSLSGASSSAGAAQLLTSNSPTDSVSTPTFKVTAGVDTADFGQGVADRVSLMMDGNLTSAKLQVNPPALGPIEVRIALQGGHAQVWLSSHSAVTRDALESSSTKLREMLGSQGFAQVSVDISQRSFQERSPQSQAYEATPATGVDAAVLAHASTSISRSASGLLDAYA